MRCINAIGIPEAVGAVALVLLILLPRGFATNDDVIAADSDDCGDSNERGWQGERGVQSRGCNLNPHQANEADSAGNDLSGGASRLSRQQWINRIRKKEMWKNLLLHRTWQARSSSSVGVHVLPRHLHTTNLEEFKALLDRAQPVNAARGDEQDPIARNRLYLPQCSGPRNSTGQWDDGTNFKLYFDVEPAAEPSGQRATRETRVLSAYIHLKRKITQTASTPRTTASSGRTGRPSSGQRGPPRRRRPLSAVYDTGASDGDSEQLKVVVYLYSRQFRRIRQETRSVIRTVFFPRNSPGWLRINLTPTVDDWVRRPQRNFGIQVTVLNEGGTEELNPGEYFEGFNCTEDHNQSVPEEYPLWTLEETLGHLSINDTVVDLDVNLTRPYLDVITTEVARSRPRHRPYLDAVRK